MKISFQKLFIYLFFCVSFITSINWFLITNSSNQSQINNLNDYFEFNKKAPKIIFLGSSRTRRGVNTLLLKKQLPTFDFYNCGIPSSSILYSLVIGEKSLQILPPQSIIFIEVSDFLIAAPNQYNYFLNNQELAQILKQHLSIRHSLIDIENFFFYIINIRLKLQSVSNPKEKIGYLENSMVYAGNNSSFVRTEELNKQNVNLNSFQEKYRELIIQFAKKAKKKHIKVIYFLPLTIEKRSERQQTIPIFNSLPNEYKWIYSSEFLEKISKTKFMSDPNHLNKYGAALNTDALINEVRSLSK